jgi:hypothetical protein
MKRSGYCARKGGSPPPPRQPQHPQQPQQLRQPQQQAMTSPLLYLRQALFDHGDHYVVWKQLSSKHVLGRLDANHNEGQSMLKTGNKYMCPCRNDDLNINFNLLA